MADKPIVQAADAMGIHAAAGEVARKTVEEEEWGSAMNFVFGVVTVEQDKPSWGCKMGKKAEMGADSYMLVVVGEEHTIEIVVKVEMVELDMDLTGLEEEYKRGKMVDCSEAVEGM